MGVLGGRAAVDLALPSSIDGSSVLNFLLRNGVSVADIIARTATAIGAVNQELADRISGIAYMTPMPYAYYRAGVGTRTQTPKKAEYKRADGSRGANSGHMLPLNDYEDALEWTALYLRDAYDAQINADTVEAADAWRNRVWGDVLTRIFTNTENAIGSGYDVPWAIGTGTNVNFIPPSYQSYSFDSTHTHFKYTNGALSGTTARSQLKTCVDELRHHGHQGRLAALVSDQDVDSYAAMTDFVKFVPANIQPVSGNSSGPVYVASGELEGVPGELFGYYLSNKGVVELRYHERIPTGYMFVTKSYGPNNPKNGVAVREHPSYGFGMRLDPQQTTSMVTPELEKVQLKATHGVGINDRTNGVCAYVAAGAVAYVNPTI